MQTRQQIPKSLVPKDSKLMSGLQKLRIEQRQNQVSQIQQKINNVENMMSQSAKTLSSIQTIPFIEQTDAHESIENPI